MKISVVEVESFCDVDSGVKEEGVVKLLAAAGVLLANLENGDPTAVGRRVGVAISKEGNDRNGKRSWQGCGMWLYECGGWRWSRHGRRRWHGRQSWHG